MATTNSLKRGLSPGRDVSDRGDSAHDSNTDGSLKLSLIRNPSPLREIRVLHKSSEALAEILKIIREVPQEPVGEHLSDEEYVGYVTGKLNDLKVIEVDLHLASCEECADEMDRILDACEGWGERRLNRQRSLLLAGLDRQLRKLESEKSHRESDIQKGVLSIKDRASQGQVTSDQTQGFITAIDVGATKIGVLIARKDHSKQPEIIGKGLAANRGTRRGNIVDIEQTVDALKEAAKDAEVMAGVKITRAYVGIAGSDICSVNSRAIISVSHMDKEITRQDVKRVVATARSAAKRTNRQVLHAIPQLFFVDNQSDITEPVGMQGTRLGVSLHVVTGDTARSSTLVACLNRAGIEVVELVFEPLATAEAVLTSDERELRVLLVDIGGASTEYALFAEGEVQQSAVLPIGANHFTHDLAIVLSIPFAEAERIKTRFGCCLTPLFSHEDEGVTVSEVADGGKRVVPRRRISEILEPRAKELLSLVREDLARSGWGGGLCGVVLTGGGAKLDGLLELTEQVLNTTVRYGLPYPALVGGFVDVIKSPTWSLAAGLLLHGLRAERNRGRSHCDRTIARQIVDRMRGVFLT